MPIGGHSRHDDRSASGGDVLRNFDPGLLEKIVAKMDKSAESYKSGLSVKSS